MKQKRRVAAYRFVHCDRCNPRGKRLAANGQEATHRLTPLAQFLFIKTNFTALDEPKALVTPRKVEPLGRPVKLPILKFRPRTIRKAHRLRAAPRKGPPLHVISGSI